MSPTTSTVRTTVREIHHQPYRGSLGAPRYRLLTDAGPLDTSPICSGAVREPTARGGLPIGAPVTLTLDEYGRVLWWVT